MWLLKELRYNSEAETIVGFLYKSCLKEKIAGAWSYFEKSNIARNSNLLKDASPHLTKKEIFLAGQNRRSTCSCFDVQAMDRNNCELQEVVRDTMLRQMGSEDLGSEGGHSKNSRAEEPKFTGWCDKFSKDQA